MKALVYTNPLQLAYRDEPDPEPRSHEALIEVEAVGVCGSDLHAYHGHDPRRVPPLILGHEAAGRVRSGPLQGRRAVLNPLSTCGRCADCTGGRSNLCRDRRLIGMNTPGGFAAFVCVPEANVIPIPDGLDPVHATLTEPGGTALHALHLAARALPRPIAEIRALVIGAGAVGLLAALLLRSYGCRDVTIAETNPLRRETARAAGIERVVDPRAGSDAPADGCAALVFDAVGTAATRRAALAAVAPGGVIAHVGLGEAGGDADFRKLTLAEVTLIGSYTYTPNDLRATLDALASGALGALDWIERRPLAAGAQAFADLDAGRTAAAKLVLVPSS